MEKRHIAVISLSLVIAVVFIFSLLYLNQSGITGLAVFTQDDETDFNEGTYSNTEFSSGAVRLSPGQTSGTYTSKIFDAGADAVWNNLTWGGNLPESCLGNPTLCSSFFSQLECKSQQGCSWEEASCSGTCTSCSGFDDAVKVALGKRRLVLGLALLVQALMMQLNANLNRVALGKRRLVLGLAVALK